MLTAIMAICASKQPRTMLIGARHVKSIYGLQPASCMTTVAKRQQQSQMTLRGVLASEKRPNSYPETYVMPIAARPSALSFSFRVIAFVKRKGTGTMTTATSRSTLIAACETNISTNGCFFFTPYP